MAARTGVTVAISGTGGDELFAGYPWFRNMVREQERARRQPLRSLAASLIGAVARQPLFDRWKGRFAGTLSRARRADGFLTTFALNHQIFGVAGAENALAARWHQEANAGRSPHFDLRPIDELAAADTLDRVTALCLRGYMNNQLLRDIDAVSMSHSLEVRVPFLDPNVVDLALSLPATAKLGPVDDRDSASITYRASGAKRILIDVARPYLPPDFDVQPKRGFGMPFADWMRGPLRPLVEESLSDESVRRRGWFDPTTVGKVRDRFFAGQLAWPQPWLLMIVERWARRFLDSQVGLQKAA